MLIHFSYSRVLYLKSCSSLSKLAEHYRYLTCAKYNKTGCHGRATVPRNGDISQLRVTQPHNHPPDESLSFKNEFYNRLKSLSMRTPADVPLRTLYDGVVKSYPDYYIPYESVRTSMRRWRNNARVEDKLNFSLTT